MAKTGLLVGLLFEGWLYAIIADADRETRVKIALQPMIKFVSGDLLQAVTQYIAQGVAVGSQEGLGSGLALKISIKWPEVQKQFKRYTRSNHFKGGDVFVVAPTPMRPGVIYVATQPDMQHASLAFVNRGLRNLVKYCAEKRIETVALPKIGAGLGKLDWATEVKPLMVQHLETIKTTFYIYEDFKSEYEKSTS